MANNYTKTMRDALNEAREYRDTTEGGPGSGPQVGNPGKKYSTSQIKKAYGILNDPRYKQGNYSGAAKAINKLAPGLADHPDVKNAMKRANENLDLPATGDTTTSNASQEDLEEGSINEILPALAVGAAAAATGAAAYKAGGAIYKGVSKIKKNLSNYGKRTSNPTGESVEEVLSELSFSDAQLAKLRKEFEPLRDKGEKNKEMMAKLKNQMRRYPRDALKTLAKADIPMVSKNARSILAPFGRMKEEVELDERVDQGGASGAASLVKRPGGRRGKFKDFSEDEIDEASRLRPTKGLWTMAQMKQQVARTEKAFQEFEQHCDFIFQMERDVGPSMSDNSGKYFDVHRALDNANKLIKKALADAKKIT